MFRMIGGVVTWPGWQVVMDKKSGKHLEIMWHMMAINDSSTPVDFWSQGVSSINRCTKLQTRSGMYSLANRRSTWVFHMYGTATAFFDPLGQEE